MDSFWHSHVQYVCIYCAYLSLVYINSNLFYYMHTFHYYVYTRNKPTRLSSTHVQYHTQLTRGCLLSLDKIEGNNSRWSRFETLLSSTFVSVLLYSLNESVLTFPLIHLHWLTRISFFIINYLGGDEGKYRAVGTIMIKWRTANDFNNNNNDIANDPIA